MTLPASLALERPYLVVVLLLVLVRLLRDSPFDDEGEEDEHDKENTRAGGARAPGAK